MKEFRWDHEKNIRLQKERGVSFEQARVAIERDGPLDVLEHPNSERYSHQKQFIILLYDYVYVVPFVEEENDTYFLKTIYPSRKLTRKYLRQDED